MVQSENTQSEAATLEYDHRVEMDCVREDCVGVVCPTGVPYAPVCVPLWGKHECRWVCWVHFTINPSRF
ncbi:hypothetical protein DPMN_169422 [Dreissena polymorpha]|uniref:Uncharacterized protein n=1 Tax=Dreissena polymorpha TaxID=45954 RepID=A0A9D4DXC9_DREPO|nr:hypothetical protein DPMN_169422 [Dreissena polymorpha]